MKNKCFTGYKFQNETFPSCQLLHTPCRLASINHIVFIIICSFCRLTDFRCLVFPSIENFPRLTRFPATQAKSVVWKRNVTPAPLYLISAKKQSFLSYHQSLVTYLPPARWIFAAQLYLASQSRIFFKTTIGKILCPSGNAIERASPQPNYSIILYKAR